MFRRLRPVIAFAVVFGCVSLYSSAQTLADKPPLGWNSWDSYGLSVTEAEWKSNVQWFHEHLQPAGWQYVVLDEGWYLQHPEHAHNKDDHGDQGYTLDGYGQFLPAPNRFPEGLSGLAKYAHGLGLKFGIHIIRGIPKLAVEQNLPLWSKEKDVCEASAAKGMPCKGAGNAEAIDRALGIETFHAADAADTADLCAWNPDNYGVRNNAAGQAYYDGLMKLYAGWGVDLLKVDCISRDYKADEIHMIRRAIDKTGRPMVLSLSPGATPLEQAADVAANSQMWRISDDVWDVWADPKLPPGKFPQTVRNQFENLARWMPYQQPGRWPDADMLPIGTLGPRPGWGKPRESRLFVDETRTLLTLWAIARSPLILGSNLLQMPPALTAMLTNQEWLAVDQTGSAPRQVYSQDGIVAWRSSGVSNSQKASYVAVFNLSDQALTVTLPWTALGFEPGTRSIRDIWQRHDLASSTNVSTQLAPHASMLYQVR